MDLVLIDFSLTVKAATLIFISGRGSAISSAKEGKSGSIYNLVRPKKENVLFPVTLPTLIFWGLLKLFLKPFGSYSLFLDCF